MLATAQTAILFISSLDPKNYSSIKQSLENIKNSHQNFKELRNKAISEVPKPLSDTFRERYKTFSKNLVKLETQEIQEKLNEVEKKKED